MHTKSQWEIASEISILLVRATKEPRAIDELISIPQKFQQSMKSSSQRLQEHALDAKEPTSKTNAQNTEINLITNPRAHHLHDKPAKELIICKNFTTIERTTVCSLQ